MQKAIETGTHSNFSGLTITKIKSDLPLLTYSKILERSLEEATSNYASSRVFGSYMSFCVFHTMKMISLNKERADAISEKVINRSHSIFQTKNDIPLPTMNNIFHTIHFSRLLAPYTIFPIKSDLRFALITGEFGILIQFNISGFERWLQKRGWKTKYIKPTKNSTSDNMPWYIPAFQIFDKDTGKGVEIGRDILTVAAMELWMPESIERVISTIIEQASTSNMYTVYTPNRGKYAWD